MLETMLDSCVPHHDWFNAVLTFGLCCGLVISYLPQHFRIIHAKSSEGISPVFLFLGTTSAAAAMFNMITLQAPIVRCCRVLTFGNCMEMSAGVIQISLQFICFGIVFILYMLYYPEHLKYIVTTSEEIPLLPQAQLKQPIRSEEWRLSIIVAWCTAAHFVFTAITTVYLITTVPDSPSGLPAPEIAAWAAFLGVSAAMLAAVQYAPQLLHTYKTKLVGALSIPMMLIQTPGGILMVISIALRPGTNWTSWITFALAALLQGCLLVMCLMWKIRQRKHQIDDFGNPLSPGSPPPAWSPRDEEIAEVYDPQSFIERDASPVPGLVTTPSEDPIEVQVALANALETASEGNILSPSIRRSESATETDEDEPPLLRRRERPPPTEQDEQERGWSAWFGR
ncbi:hypothetical protein BDN70DRAFT_915336 [Pholiota conissans]|uniref:PQ loop repeat protein n=1 Tax=Pholiota conissans TaxID=109636 RepID=A0A9P5YV27_9AGAR|nr:hypothetical protein BDN70DRAFT_915336 [Pholiota conissans]